jgi:ABC-type multidrug transport system permease subunit
MLDVIGAGIMRDVKTDFFQAYTNSDLCASNLEMTNSLAASKSQRNPLHIQGNQFPGTWLQIKNLTVKFFWIYWRSPNYNFTRFMFLTCCSLLFGCTYWGLQPRDVQSAQSVLGIVFYSMTYAGMINYILALPVIFGERVVYYRERASNLYSAFAYRVALILVELPYLFTCSIVFVSIFFNFVRWNGAFDLTQFATHWLVVFLYFSCTTFFGQALGALCPNILVAQLTGNIVYCIWFLLGGLYFPFPSIRPTFVQLGYVVPSSYGFRALAVANFYCDFSNMDNTCPMIAINGSTTRMNYNGTDPYLSQYMDDEYGFYSMNGISNVTDTAAVQALIGRDIWVLVALSLGFQVLAYIGLRYVKHINR